jgi:hypothetical protein
MTAAMKARYPSRAQIKRALQGASDTGKEVGGYEVEPDGTIRVLFGRATSAAGSAFDRWAAKDGR